MHNANAFMDNTQQAHQRGWGLRRRGGPCWKRRVRGAIWVARGGPGCELPTIELVLPFRSVGGVRQIRLRFGIGPVSEKIGYARPAPSDAWHAKVGNGHFGGHVHYPIFVPQTVHFWGLLFRYRAGLSQRSSGTGPANGTKPDRFRTSISSCWRKLSLSSVASRAAGGGRSRVVEIGALTSLNFVRD